MGCSKSSSKRDVYSNTILLQERRKTSNRQPNFTPETTGKFFLKIGRRKEIIKFRADIIEKEIRGRWEGGSRWGIHVNPWLIHFNV